MCINDSVPQQISFDAVKNFSKPVGNRPRRHRRWQVTNGNDLDRLDPWLPRQLEDAEDSKQQLLSNLLEECSCAQD